MNDDVILTYLGAGGWLIENGAHAVMTAPLFSNPSLLAVAGASIGPDESRINAMASRLDLSRVEGILVGHGHYDHLMDVPVIASRYASTALVYGNLTSRHQVAELLGEDSIRFVVVEGRAGTPDREGSWTQVGPRFRFMPVVSDHSPHFGQIRLFQGQRTAELESPPATAHDWLDGTTLAYVIDVLDPSGDPHLRLYYNDSPASWPDGFPPLSLVGDERVPIVAVLTAPGHRWVEDYPQRLISYLRPGWILAGHWEDFFVDPRSPPHPIPFTYFDEFRDKMKETSIQWWAPRPGARFVFKSRQ